MAGFIFSMKCGFFLSLKSIFLFTMSVVLFEVTLPYLVKSKPQEKKGFKIFILWGLFWRWFGEGKL